MYYVVTTTQLMVCNAKKCDTVKGHNPTDVLLLFSSAFVVVGMLQLTPRNINK